MCSSREGSPWSPPFWCVGPRPSEARCRGPEGRRWGQRGAPAGWDRAPGALWQPGALARPESSEVRWLWRRQRAPLGVGGPGACWRGPESGGEPGRGRLEPGSAWRPPGAGPRGRAPGPPCGRRPRTWRTGAGCSSHLEQEAEAARGGGKHSLPSRPPQAGRGGPTAVRAEESPGPDISEPGFPCLWNGDSRLPLEQQLGSEGDKARGWHVALPPALAAG